MFQNLSLHTKILSEIFDQFYIGVFIFSNLGS
jgi:hypothetical protein